MIKKLITATMLTAVFGAGALPVMAQTTISGSQKTTFTDNSGNHDQGFFNVQVQQASAGSLLWHVTVSFDHAVPGVNPDTVNLDKIVVRLLPVPAPPAPGVNVPGELVASGGNAMVNKGLASQVNWDSLALAREVDYSDQTDPITGDDIVGGLVTDQGQVFTADITLQAGDPVVKGVYFDLIGSGSGTGIFPGAPVTPEGASLLLLLPGLIPVAVGLRRRRLKKPAGE